jgi:Zn-dependent protease with chaperone function
MSLKAGLEALKQERYRDAVQILKDFCLYYTQPGTKEYLQAQMALVKGYHRLGDDEQAIAIAQELSIHENSQISRWANQALSSLTDQNTLADSLPITASSTTSAPIPSTSNAIQQAGRAAKTGVKLAMISVGGNLAVASGITLALLFGMVLVLSLAIVLILDSHDPVIGLAIALAITVIFNSAAFFLSPYIMDLTQRWLYNTRWVTLAEIEQQSPEAARVIQYICRQKKLKTPRLGIIDDQNPTAFTYGSLPNSARLVVSQGLFTYLEDDEIATVYAHELGHIIHWDFAVMTLASTLVQITYLIYIFARRLGRGGNDKFKNAAGTAALVAYVFYLVGTYLLLYLSRTREYFADHFAAEITGNPNALSRALVKIAYGIVEQSKQTSEPNRLMEGTRALGIYDAKAAASTGTVYPIATKPYQMGRVFLWDLFNPWGWWMELNSTHPLTGKRVRALSTYAEQLDLPTEFDMGRIVQDGKRLSKKKLYGNFAIDLLIYSAIPIGFFVGLVVGIVIQETLPLGIFACPILGLGLGTLIRTFVMFPSFQQAPETDVLKLMSDPYASPLRGRPVNLQGALIGRGDAGYEFGSDLKFQDNTGMIYLHYASRFGSLGNFLFGMNRVKNLLGARVGVTGWFRRGVAPWVDLTQFTTESGTVVKSFHRLWSFILGGAAMVVATVLLMLTSALIH